MTDTAWPLIGVDTDRGSRYPWSDGTARTVDPTHGRIDRDIQWGAWEVCTDGGKRPLANVAQLAALEHNLQAKRARGHTVLGVIPGVDDPARPGVDPAFAAGERAGTLGLGGSILVLAGILVLGVLGGLAITIAHGAGLIP